MSRRLILPAVICLLLVGCSEAPNLEDGGLPSAPTTPESTQLRGTRTLLGSLQIAHSENFTMVMNVSPTSLVGVMTGGSFSMSDPGVGSGVDLVGARKP